MELTTVWFALIAVLWIGYFILDGFDLGVGMLLPVIGKDDLSRRVMINSIATVWDGNEVWLLVAGGATFAAFPLWYATMFSGMYLALFLVLVGFLAVGLRLDPREVPSPLIGKPAPAFDAPLLHALAEDGTKKTRHPQQAGAGQGSQS